MKTADQVLIIGAPLIVVLALIVFAIVLSSNDTRTEDCEAICRTNGSHMERVTEYGCLCANGELTAEPTHSSTYVQPVVVSP